MGYYSSNRGSRKGSGQKFQKSQHEKAKARVHKHREKGTYAEGEGSPTAGKAAEKTLNNLKHLGEQKFAVSPFRQYFDDWLLNVKQTLSEFESKPEIAVDEAFAKQREQTLTKVERELAELKQEEKALELCVKELADTNHMLVDLDANYAAKTRETSTRKNNEIQNLTKKVQELETKLEQAKAIKTSFIGGVSKKAKAKMIEEATSELEAKKTELKQTIERFGLEQDKLHDIYEKKKHLTMDKVQKLEKEIEKLENDRSQEARHHASEALVEAVKALLERQPKPSSE
jgi:DNA repair exonuclease SbcCD ATPase subunit